MRKNIRIPLKGGSYLSGRGLSEASINTYSDYIITEVSSLLGIRLCTTQ